MNPEEIKIKSSEKLITVIIHGCNDFGYRLTQLLTQQGARVVIIDSYTKDNKQIINDLKKLKDVDFIDFSGINEFFNSIGRIDYLFYLQNAFIAGKEEFSSKEFIHESNSINLALQSAKRFDAKVSLITSVKVNRDLLLHRNGAGQEQSPYSAVELQKYSETLAAETHDRTKLNLRIIRLGTVLGVKDYAHDDSELHEMIKSSVTLSAIPIRGEGLNTHYLIHIEDALYGILKLTFTPETDGEVISLAHRNEYTSLSIAYKLLELNTHASTVQFGDQNQDQQLIIQSHYAPAPNCIDYGFTPEKQLEQMLVDSLKVAYENANKTWTPEEKPVIEKKEPTFKNDPDQYKPIIVKTPLGIFIDRIVNFFQRLFSPITALGRSAKDIWKPANLIWLIGSFAIFLVAFYYLLGPVLSIGISSLILRNNVNSVKASVSALDFESASQKLTESSRYVTNIDESLERLDWLFELSNQKPLQNNLRKITTAAEYGVEGATDLTGGLAPIGVYLQNYEPNIDANGKISSSQREYLSELTELHENRPQLQRSAYNIRRASSIIESLDESVFPTFAQKYIVDLKAENALLMKTVDPVQDILPFLADLLGREERQTYLVLLQNPSELRATGGWLSSAGVIGIERGRIRVLEFFDIYNIDGDMKVAGKTFEPPEDMADALDIDEWSMSLSNWEPDFAATAEDAEFFLKESGKVSDVNGVIAVDVTFVQRLLDVWGGIKLPGENETITSQNLYDKIFEMHRDFTPGSSQKAGFLGDLISEVATKLFQSDPEQLIKISDTLSTSLDQKNILVNLDNSSAAKYFAGQRWDGRLIDSYKTAPISVEWNWGANKANLFLDQSIDLTVNITSETSISYEYVKTIRNRSTTKVYPEGDYINYQRVYLPEKAELISVEGFDSNRFTTEVKDGYKIISGFFNTPAESTNELKVSYKLADSDQSYYPITSNGSSRQFNLSLYKQPGLFDYKTNVFINFPVDWLVTDAGGMNQNRTELSTTKTQLRDIDLQVKFRKE